MSTKLYDKIKQFLNENKFFIFSFVFFLILFNIKLPYYIKMPGGLASVERRLTIEGASVSKGSYNLAYVSELDATLPALLIAYFHPDWDIVKKEDVILVNETEEDENLRSHLLLDEANQNAVIYAYHKANKEVLFSNVEVYITYVAEEAETNLKVGDKILKVNEQLVENKEQLHEIIESKNIGDTLFFKVLRNDKEIDVSATIIEIEGSPKIGLMITEKKDIKTNPNFSFHFSLKESGSSGGLMMSLAIYDALMEEDFTKGLTIVGTGTIDEEGIVGDIAGVRYKVIGAAKEGADIFFVPSGENYEEAIKVKNEKKYSIDIIPVTTFDDALSYLQNLEN